MRFYGWLIPAIAAALMWAAGIAAVLYDNALIALATGAFLVVAFLALDAYASEYERRYMKDARARRAPPRA
jgi:hypothetical protein